MHAVFITFRSPVSAETLEEKEGYTQYAEALRDGAVPGFLSKVWFRDGVTDGGFQLFHNRQAADDYLDGMFTQVILSDPTITDVRIERFDVAETLSAITNGLPATVVGAAT